MRYFVSFLLIMSLISVLKAQDKFVLTQHGVVSSQDSNNPYLIVEMPTISNNDILEGIRGYVQKYWKNPMRSLKIENNSAVLSYNHIISIGSKKYRLEGVMTIDVKDDRFRASFNLIGLYREVVALAIYQHYHFTKEFCPKGTIYFRRGIYEGDKVIYPKQKAAIEDFLNQEVNDIKMYLLKQIQEDW